MFCQVAGLDIKFKSTVIALLSHSSAGDVLTQWLLLTKSILHPRAYQMGEIWKRMIAWDRGTGQHLALCGSPRNGHKSGRGVIHFTHRWTGQVWLGREGMGRGGHPVQAHVIGYGIRGAQVLHTTMPLTSEINCISCHNPDVLPASVPHPEPRSCEMRTAHLLLSKHWASKD